MKKLLCALLILIMVVGCSSKNKVNKEITESDIKNISGLSTLDISFNNVVKCKQSKDYNVLITTLTATSQAWAEYQGNVKVGIDMNELIINVDSKTKKISIVLPKAKILNEPTDNIAEIEDKFFQYSKNWVSQNITAKITSDLKQQAIAEAKQNMIDTINNNESILKQAQDRAKMLIENFIIQNGDYEIEWTIL